MNNKKKINLQWIWYIILIFLGLGYIITPFIYTFLQALKTETGYGLDVFREFFSNFNQVVVIRNTIVLGILTVIVCGIIGILLAVYMTFFAKKYKKLLHILLLSPMMVPGVIIVISFIQLYGESGIITKGVQYLLRLEEVPFEFQGLGAILFIIAYTQYVYFYLNVYIALKYVDYSTIEAARSMGASWRAVFMDVVWPVITPAVLSSTILTFASGVSSFSAPNLIGGYKVLSTQIVKSKANYDMEMASVQVVILFAISILFMIVVQCYSKKHKIYTSDRSTEIQIINHRGIRIFGSIIVGVQVVFIMLPIAAIVYLSFIRTSSIMQDIFPRVFTFENYTVIFEKSRVLKPLLNSLKMSLIAVVLGLVITVPTSYMVVRQKNRMNVILKMIMLIPATMPSSVIAVNLINAFNKENVFAFFQVLIGGFMILPIAYTVISLPLLLSSNETAMKGLNSHIEEASKSLGAHFHDTFLHVIMPNIAPGIIAGGVLVFIRTIGEYTMSALLYGVYNRPISISMVTNMQEYNIGISLAYGVIVILICYVALGVVFKLDKKRFI